jgi:hypothetical protein
MPPVRAPTSALSPATQPPPYPFPYRAPYCSLPPSPLSLPPPPGPKPKRGGSESGGSAPGLHAADSPLGPRVPIARTRASPRAPHPPPCPPKAGGARLGCAPRITRRLPTVAPTRAPTVHSLPLSLGPRVPIARAPPRQEPAGARQGAPGRGRDTPRGARRAVAGVRMPPSLVLSGHAASLTPY